MSLYIYFTLLIFHVKQITNTPCPTCRIPVFCFKYFPMASIVNFEDNASSLKMSSFSGIPYRLRVEGINPTCTHKALESAVRAALRLGRSSTCSYNNADSSSTSIVVPSPIIKQGLDGGIKTDGGNEDVRGDEQVTSNRRTRRRQQRMERGSKKGPSSTSTTK